MGLPSRLRRVLCNYMREGHVSDVQDFICAMLGCSMSLLTTIGQILGEVGGGPLETAHNSGSVSGVTSWDLNTDQVSIWGDGSIS